MFANLFVKPTISAITILAIVLIFRFDDATAADEFEPIVIPNSALLAPGMSHTIELDGLVEGSGYACCDDEIMGEISLESSNVNERQVIDLKDLVPGRMNRIILKVRNPTPAAIDVKTIEVSCGCMVVKDFPSDIKAGGSVPLAIELRVGVDAREESRELRLISSDGRVWILTLKCGILNVFESKQEEFKLSPEDGSVKLSFSKVFSEIALENGLLPDLSDEIKCSFASGKILDSLKVQASGRVLNFELVVDSVRLGAKRRDREAVELSTDKFCVAFEISFFNSSPVIVSPSRCSRLKLLRASQKFLIFSEPGLGKLSWRGVQSNGTIVSVNIASSLPLRNGSMVEISSESDGLDECERLEVFEESLPEKVLCTVRIEK